MKITIDLTGASDFVKYVAVDRLIAFRTSLDEIEEPDTVTGWSVGGGCACGLASIGECDGSCEEPEPWTFGDLEVGDWFDAFGYGGSPYCKVVSTWYDVGGLDALMNAINSDGEPCRIPDGEEVWPFEWEWSE